VGGLGPIWRSTCRAYIECSYSSIYINY